VKRVAFYYDFVCPYAYIASTQIEAMCARAGAELSFCPMLLGGLLQTIGAPTVPMTTMSAPKLRLNALDMHRWAEHFGVPLSMPPTHPNRTILALRAALAAEGDLPRASKALFSAYWAEGLDLSRPEVVQGALDRAGLDGEALIRRAGEPAIKDALRARTSEAARHGVFGVPTFIVTAPGVEGDLFWGQDRMHFVEKALGGWSVSPGDRP